MKLGHHCLLTHEVNIAQKPSHEFSSSVSKYLCGKVFFQLDMYSYLPNIRGGPIKRGEWKISQKEINGEG